MGFTKGTIRFVVQMELRSRNWNWTSVLECSALLAWRALELLPKDRHVKRSNCARDIVPWSVSSHGN